MMDPESLAEVLPAVTPGIMQRTLWNTAAFGVLGLCFGGVVGTIKGSTPFLFSMVSGAQCAVLGGTATASLGFSRIAVARAYNTDVSSFTRGQHTAMYTMSGITTGAIGGAIRGRRNIIPGIVVIGTAFTLASLLTYDRPRALVNEPIKAQDTGPNLAHRVFNSSFSPMKMLSDAEYEQKLQEKLIRIEAEIALIDENIAKVKAEQLDPSSHSAKD